MKELSLHILDIAQNSIEAKACVISLKIKESLKENQLTISVEDDGVGMDKELLCRVENPFTTTRTTRKVGLGISLLKSAAERCNGALHITSKKGVGTKVEACFQYDHIDRAPLGNMPETIASIVLSMENSELIYEHSLDHSFFYFDTREVKSALGSEVSIRENEVISWIKDYIKEGLQSLYGGVKS
ncbi:ATP-binding protein [Irregularibacter muris]|uniref:histidine kinase n=1 Tax=Irregularibacter muris TaxID=1796619 RepID=A0AAE3HJ96_9FIRM|nr:ATP-binding protein [Irregularibacter muris]MCR1899884.1 ATP-binding protein [Irregularibacter muris]